jgi:hypothetical protein
MIEFTQPANGLTASPGRPKPTLCLTSETSGNALPEVFHFAGLVLRHCRSAPTFIQARRCSRINLVQARKFAIVA